jgi:hypothetical protein
VNESLCKLHPKWVEFIADGLDGRMIWQWEEFFKGMRVIYTSGYIALGAAWLHMVNAW